MFTGNTFIPRLSELAGTIHALMQSPRRRASIIEMFGWIIEFRTIEVALYACANKQVITEKWSSPQ